MHGAKAEARFKILMTPRKGGGDPLRDVLTAGIDQRSTILMYSGGHTQTSGNSDRAEATLNAAASISSADMKARIFDAGSDSLRSILEMIGLGMPTLDEGEAAFKVTCGLTNILRGDTTASCMNWHTTKKR